MPLMSGVEVAREVRGLGHPLYIVGCTGNALREDQVSHKDKSNYAQLGTDD